MKSSQKSTSRKKFLLLTAMAFCSASILRLVSRKKKDRLYTVKMLAQDGTLVEVDRKWLGPPRKKISDRELQQWVKHNAEKIKTKDHEL
jgi:hypothetical protein